VGDHPEQVQRRTLQHLTDEVRRAVGIEWGQASHALGRVRQADAAQAYLHASVHGTLHV